MSATMHTAGYAIDIVVTGFPGKSVCHGALGWSSIALLRGHDRTALIDVGAFSYRSMLTERLADRSLALGDITDVVLTHSHWDHSVNWVMFPNARVHLGATELSWALEQKWGRSPVPELYIEKLAGWPTLRRIGDGGEVLPGMRAHLGPGHTPGCLVFVVEGERHDVIFTGDAAKNRAELVSRTTDMTYDRAISAATIDMIWQLWRKRPGTIVIPGHDVPMVLEGGVPTYLGRRRAAITTWYGQDMETTTRFELVV